MTTGEKSVTHHTFSIERTFETTPDRVFAAFADPARKRRWFGDDRGLEVESFEMDFQPGGRDRISYRMKQTSPIPGATITNETTYQDIIPGKRIVLAYSMLMNGRRFSVSLATFEFLLSKNGTTLIFTDQGAYFEGSDGPQMREDGWRKLLEYLGNELARS
jgi:uncharacterized protein YndB with AHSA1/START domain